VGGVPDADIAHHTVLHAARNRRRRRLTQFFTPNNFYNSVAGADVLPVGPLEQRALARFVLE
jgi:hypothetical protein